MPDDPRLIRPTIRAMLSEAEQYLVEIAQQSDPESFEAAWGGALFMLKMAASGDFKGTIELQMDGTKVHPVQVFHQRVNVPEVFRDVYDRAKGG